MKNLKGKTATLKEGINLTSFAPLEGKQLVIKYVKSFTFATQDKEYAVIELDGNLYEVPVEYLDIDGGLPVVAEISISYSTKVPAKSRVKIKSSEDAAKVLRPFFDADKMEFREEFKVILLNRSNQVLGVAPISTGSMAGCVVDSPAILSAAILSRSCAIILCHNHPSGALKPSHADIKLTRDLKQGARLLSIDVLDHIILTAEGYYSLADSGICDMRFSLRNQEKIIKALGNDYLELLLASLKSEFAKNKEFE